MALTVTKQKAFPVGDRWQLVVHVLWDSSYPTDGESFTAADVGLSTLDYVSSEIAAVDSGTGAVVVKYDYANAKLQAFEAGTASAALDEDDNADDLSAFESVHVVVGTGTVPAL